MAKRKPTQNNSTSLLISFPAFATRWSTSHGLSMSSTLSSAIFCRGAGSSFILFSFILWGGEGKVGEAKVGA